MSEEPFETPAAPAAAPPPEVNPLQATIDALQQQLDATVVEKDKAIADSQSKLAEMQRRYEIAVKTGSKTGAQAQPVSENPVADFIEKTFKK